MFYVYIIQSERDQSYYVGQTKDVDRRLQRHNSGRGGYTKLQLPWKIVHIESYPTRLEAIQREQEIKKMESKKYIEQLIKTQTSQHLNTTGLERLDSNFQFEPGRSLVTT